MLRMFFGRTDEQRRFKALIEAVSSASSEGGSSPVMLVQGLGGMGKSTLLERYRKLATELPDGSGGNWGATPIVVWVNFQDERDGDNGSERYPGSTGPQLLTVLMALHAACVKAVVAESPQGSKQTDRAFRSFRRVASELTGRYPSRSSDDNPVVATARPFERVGGTSGVLVTGVVEGLAIAVRARQRSRADSEALELAYRPEEPLVRAFAAGIRTLSEDRPIFVILDTYEIVASTGGWLRSAMRQTGSRVAWVVAGRLEVDATAGERSDSASFQRELEGGSLRIVNLVRFPDENVSELLEARGVEASPTVVNAVAAVTRGVPLAVDLVAGGLARGADLDEVIRSVDLAGDGAEVVTELARWYLKHARADPFLEADIPLLYGLALTRADRTDPPLLAALWGTSEDVVGSQLEGLATRHDFVLTRSRRLHVDVRDTFRSYLLDATRRAEVRAANERAVSVLLTRLSLNDRMTIESQIDDDEWRSWVAALLWHELWIDNERGLERLLEVFPSAALLHRALAHELIDVTSFFSDTFSSAQQSLLRGLASLLSFGQFLDGWLSKRRIALMRDPALVAVAGRLKEPTDVDRQGALERLALRSKWDAPVVAGDPPRHAIVSLLNARSSVRADPERAIDALEVAAGSVPADDRRFAKELAATAHELTTRLVFEAERSGERPSPTGLRAARLATRYDDTPDSWISVALTLSRLDRDGDAVEAYDEIVRRFGEDPDPELRRQTARALFNKGVALGRLERPQEEIGVYDEIVRRFGEDPDPELRRQTAKALSNKGFELGRLERHGDAVEAYDDLVRHFGEDPDPELRRQTAIALFNKGVTLGRLERPQEKIGVYDEIVRRFGEDPDPELRRQTAKALINKGFELGRLERHEDAVKAYDEIVLRFGEDSNLELRRQTAKALFNKGVALGRLERPQEKIGVYDEIVRRFGEDPDPELRRQTAKALINKGFELGRLERNEDLVEACDDLVRRFGEDPDPELRRQTAKALFNKGVALGQLERPQEEIGVYGELLRQFGDDPDLELRRHTAMALNNKASMLGELERNEDLVEACDDLVRRFGEDPDPELRRQTAKALSNKGFELGRLERHGDAVEAYDDLVRHFGEDPDPELRRQTAIALFNKGVTLGRLERPQEKIGVYDEIVRRFGEDPDPELRRQTAKALSNKGFELGRLERHGDAVEAYDDLVRHFGEDPDPELRRQTARALNSKAYTLGRLERPLDAVGVYDELLRQFGNGPDPELRRQTARALNSKALVLRRLERPDDALAANEEVIERFGEDPDGELRTQVATALHRKADRARRTRSADVAELARRAGAAYELAVAAVPDDAALLGNYALLRLELGEHERADEPFARAVELDPENANHLANYARLKFERGLIAEGVELADRAVAVSGPGDKPVVAEVAIYFLALGLHDRQEESLRSLKRLIDEGVRSPGWDFGRILARSREFGGGRPLTVALAGVISGDLDPEVLAERQDWPPSSE